MLLGLVALSLGILAAPWLVGFEVQRQIESFFRRADDSGLDLVSWNYRRGWFVSKAEAVFAVPVASAFRGSSPAGKRPRLIIRNRIEHGPLTLSPSGGASLDPGLARIESRLYADGRPVVADDAPGPIQTRIGFSMTGSTRVRIPAFTLGRGEEGVNVGPIQGQARFEVNRSRFAVRIRAGSFRLAPVHGVDAAGQSLSMEYNGTRSAGGFWLGEWRLRADRLILPAGWPPSRLELKDNVFSWATSEASDGIAVAVACGVNELITATERYGPLSVSLLVERLSPAALGNLRDAATRLNGPASSTGTDFAGAAGALGGAAAQILRQDPVLTLRRLHMGTPRGDIYADVKIGSRGMNPVDLGSPAALLDKLDIDLSLRLPEAVAADVLAFGRRVLGAAQAGSDRYAVEGGSDPAPGHATEHSADRTLAQRQLDRLVVHELVVRDETGALSTHARLAHGLFSVNGKTYPLEAVGGLRR